MRTVILRSSKNETVVAFVNLYSIWASLCKASSFDETKDSIALLKAYSSMESMKAVKEKILFTLWYLTSEQLYADLLLKEFPSSPEAGIINGTVQIASVPFWYFVPRSSEQTAAGNKTSETAVSSKKESEVSSENKNPSAEYERKKSACIKQQLGLYKSKENAIDLIKQVRVKGFDAYYYSETRASGTTYFIVVVDDADRSLGKKISQSGFDCYPVE